ncbi:AbrB/MazE/SpoVT family DNA-binding domain-containing protein [Ethanoligenens harbinense]|uniref:Transcriptional regulator, AbrB family n=1 Tax=Ethanoligenens harbinense (strain DSM 18485 / JCM 12961 / CGMCC 1.5033 / YUAN-3) TaxID=663278 RepID=E6U5B1_ETHHY|nr:transcriptional regulator, AbrB family [Ethanoligenens harbinense YUAN-3]AVQ96953.1 hypothetical protein CXQ68_12480 [Ethanoligenens harbinense YUAN-3]AYF39613.1 hypothetical protein CXP51_12375 [Ethanoligenens harbinense]AYF42441.1 hypothetical protein CN246_12930 [Ethanoligenens harbinense]QCN93194.1 hypothetical protein DRA42_12525 [Ethanoligenens harbinense]
MPGIVRNIDQNGHLVIPKGVRKTLGIPEGTCLEVWVDRNRIILRKQKEAHNEP